MNFAAPSEELLKIWHSRRAGPNFPADLNLNAVISDGVEVGVAAFRLDVERSVATLFELWTVPERRRRGHGRAALRLFEDHCRGQGMRRAQTSVDPRDPAQAALLRAWPVTSSNMELQVTEAPELPDGVRAVRMSTEVFDVWQQSNMEHYAVSIAENTGEPLETARRASRAQFAELLPQRMDTPEHEFWELRFEETLVAKLWVHVNRADGFVFVYDLEAEPGHRGKGYGRAVTRLAETRALAAGLDRVRLHVFADNVTAAGLYRALGYQTFRDNRSVTL